MINFYLKKQIQQITSPKYKINNIYITYGSYNNFTEVRVWGLQPARNLKLFKKINNKKNSSLIPGYLLIRAKSYQSAILKLKKIIKIALKENIKYTT
jgi:hypothetical protein